MATLPPSVDYTRLRVQYIAPTYRLRTRRDRLRARGMLAKTELAARLGVHVSPS